MVLLSQLWLLPTRDPAVDARVDRPAKLIAPLRARLLIAVPLAAAVGAPAAARIGRTRTVMVHPLRLAARVHVPQRGRRIGRWSEWEARARPGTESGTAERVTAVRDDGRRWDDW